MQRKAAGWQSEGVTLEPERAKERPIAQTAAPQAMPREERTSPDPMRATDRYRLVTPWALYVPKT